MTLSVPSGIAAINAFVDGAVESAADTRTIAAIANRQLNWEVVTRRTQMLLVTEWPELRA